MTDVIEVWSRSGENLEAIACIVLEIYTVLRSMDSWLILMHVFSGKQAFIAVAKVL